MENGKTISSDLVRKWIDGTADKEEREAVAEWASQSEYLEKKLISDKMVYLASLSAEAGSKDGSKSSRVRKIIYWTMTAAASVAIVLSLFLFYSEVNKGRELSAVNISVPVGQMSRLKLSDGTEVWLNSNSQLDVVDGNRGDRIVALKGEAFFEVAKDTEHPFIVRCGDRSVKVLGTSFNVTSYSPDNFSVTLFTGSVEMTDALNDYCCTLAPGEQIDFVDGHYVRNIDSGYDGYGWKGGKQSFADASLETIMRRVGDYFGVSIEFQEESMKLLRCTCAFHSGNSLENILDIICMAYDDNIKYVISEDRTTVTLEYRNTNTNI